MLTRVAKVLGIAGVAGLLATTPVAADTKKTVKLYPQSGAAIAVATITFAKGGGYKVDWDDSKFGDFFLSMRPFKCLQGPVKLWCRVPYPYTIKRSVAGGDLTDLEYDLLFVWKNAKDYGINLWNGVYYQLSEKDGKITGALHEFDVNELAAPPEDGNLRPITDAILDEGDPDSHWLPRITIE